MAKNKKKKSTETKKSNANLKRKKESNVKSKRKVKIPETQGKSKVDVGYKKPPKEYQFKPGQSGNPAGNVKNRTHLWRYFCRYMAMTPAEIKAIDRDKLTLSQAMALKIAENGMRGKYSGSERLARHVFDREEGKPTEYLVVGGNDNAMTDEKCEEIRKLLQKRC